jgi:hypothetical protein
MTGTMGVSKLASEHKEPRWRIGHAIDWERFAPVVFESDDWGGCEAVPDAEAASALQPLWDELLEHPRPIATTLESPADLTRLYETLSGFAGDDGIPAVFTAFMPMGNPDFAAIAAGGFERFCDIGISDGVPPRWERGDLLAAWRDGAARGVFEPEYHGRLHHNGPRPWLALLRGEGPRAELARASFEHEVYCQGIHLPEFEAMDVREQYQWNLVGVQRFEAAFGRTPAAGITSDAFPETETIWALLGIRTVCLKSCRVNSGQIVVYTTKLWNNQDPDVPIGAHDPVNDVIYLTRNAFFECAGGKSQSAEAVLPVIRSRWAEGEPAVVSTHRANYVSLDAVRAETGFTELSALLQSLHDCGARFLTTAEVSDLYRQGWSLREFGGTKILRRWSPEAEPVRLPCSVTGATAIPDGREYLAMADGACVVLDLPAGDYRLTLAHQHSASALT